MELQPSLVLVLVLVMLLVMLVLFVLLVVSMGGIVRTAVHPHGSGLHGQRTGLIKNRSTQPSGWQWSTGW
jgi:hypothetical protein